MLETLLDRSEGDALPLPATLAERYGGPLRFPRGQRPYLVANFVETLDGVTSYGVPGKAHAAVISAANPADRFLLGLLRAVSDVVVVGAATLRTERKHVWTAEHVFKDVAEEFRALRAALGKRRHPDVVFVTARGEVDLTAPAFHAPEQRAFVLTTSRGAAKLHDAGTVRVLVGPEGDALASETMLDLVVEATGARLVLSEGGSTLLGRFLGEGRLDELFLTVAPQVAGRDAASPRLHLVEGRGFAPDRAPWLRLVSAKAAGDFLFLRYGKRAP